MRSSASTRPASNAFRRDETLAPAAVRGIFDPMTETTEDRLPLAAEFPSATREDWLKLVQAALKGAPVERLRYTAHDGLTVEPLAARRADARPIVGRVPAAPWQVMARVDHPDPAVANAEALHELENGATALSLVFAGATGSYGYGLPPDADSIARALEGVATDAILIDLDISESSKDAAAHLAGLVRQRGGMPGSHSIRFGHDPIGAQALSGMSPLPWRDLAPRFAAHVAELAGLGFTGPLTVADGRVIHNAGGSEAQELAYVTAVAVAYLRAFESAGLGLAQARGMIEFRLSADAAQFPTIAKFRAVRKLWARIEDACGLAPRPAFVSAETAWRMMTRRDPQVNMLRTTIAAFAAGVGGADAVTVLPFTLAIGLPDRFARRVARNSQLILLDESNLARVADPSAGSGAIEALTDQFCRAAWTQFQEIEQAGGAAAALEAGLIQRQVFAVRNARQEAIASGREAITGTTVFPNTDEVPVAVLDVAPLPAERPGDAAKALTPRRLAEPYEG
jgi:methylmalonyl-CoA mutase